MTKKLGLQALLLTLLLSLGAVVHAQVSTVGSIGGTVRDPQGAAVPNAEVTVTEETTGLTRTVTTNDEGVYLVAGISAGRYNVSTAPAGFKKTVNPGVQLHVAERLTLDITLEVGAVGETVTVTGEAQLVETRNSDVSSLVTEKQVTELPLNGRNYAQLVTLVPGISPVTQAGAGGAFGTGGTGLDSHVDMSVNGNGSNTNLWTVDGVNNMDVGSNANAARLPVHRLDSGVPRRAQQLQRRVRAGAGRGHQPHHEDRRQRVPRHALRVLPQRRAQRQRLLQQPCGALRPQRLERRPRPVTDRRRARPAPRPALQQLRLQLKRPHRPAALRRGTRQGHLEGHQPRLLLLE